MGKRITGRRENETGGNTHYRVGNKTIPRGEAIKECKKGNLDGYHVMKVNNREYLRDNPDKSKSDNIDSQPLI